MSMAQLKIQRIQRIIYFSTKALPRCFASTMRNFQRLICSCRAKSTVRVWCYRSKMFLPFTASIHFAHSVMASFSERMPREKTACRKRRDTSFDETIPKVRQSDWEEEVAFGIDDCDASNYRAHWPRAFRASDHEAHASDTASKTNKFKVLR